MDLNALEIKKYNNGLLFEGWSRKELRGLLIVFNC